jgi:hypothetical protein
MIYILETARSMESEIIYDYVINYMSNSDLSKKYKINRIRIQRILKKNNIVLRKRTPGIKVNHDFFSNYNKDSCYWAGFILADGSIRNNKRFTLQIKLANKDYKHLQKFKECIGFEGDIKKGSHFFQLTISSKKIVDDLELKFEIKEKKSLVCSISDNIPDCYMTDFIRGYLDGDGTLTFTTCNTLGFLGTFDTLNKISDFIYNNGIKLRSKSIPGIYKKNNIYCINYYGISAIKVSSLLYSDSIENLRLDRKYKIYEKWKFDNG